MKPILKALLVLVYFVGCYELVVFALSLLTYPSDVSFIGGLAILLVLLVGNVELAAHYVKVLKGKNA
jgi:hypothetical protein